MRDRLSEQLIAELHKLVPANCRIQLIRERPWASITFSGTRYHFDICPSDQQPDREMPLTQAGLADHEFDLKGHFVADAVLKPGAPDYGRNQRLEILVIVDPVDQR